MISFKNIKAESLGVVFDRLPSIPIGAPRHKNVVVPGRDGNLTISDDSRDPITVDLSGHVLDMDRHAISSWLSGAGTLIFDEQPDHLYDARVVDIVELEPKIRDNQAVKLKVTFELQPFARLASGQEWVYVDGDTVTLQNPGNTTAYPFIRVYGEGDLEIRVSNRVVLVVKDVASYVDIDAELDIVSRGSAINLDHKSTGEMPTLGLGQTTIRVVGNVSKIQVQPRWRVL